MKGLVILTLLMFFSTCLAAIVPGSANCSHVDLTNATAIQTYLDMSVSCGQTEIVVILNPCVLEQMGYNLTTDITIHGFGKYAQDFQNGTICSSVTSFYEPEVGWMFTISEPFSQCDMDVVQENGAITYSNAVRSVQHSNVGDKIIVRRNHIYLPFQCTYQTEFNETDLGEIDPNVIVLSANSSESSGGFGQTAKLCKDVNCTLKVTAGEKIDVLSQLYIVVEVDSTSLTIMIDDIWATDNASDITAYLVQGECLEEDEVPYATLKNSMVSKSYLEFQVFHFAADEETDIFFHVTYELCDGNAAGGDCSPATCTRKRRSTRASSQKAISETIGPFRVRVI